MDCNSLKSICTAVISLSLAAAALTSCSEESASNKLAANPPGSVSLETVKVGSPELLFKDAMITFTVDNNPAATSGGKTQYLSRNYNAKGGQLIAECKDGKCFELETHYANQPVTKDEALSTLTQMLPDGTPPQSRVEDKEVKGGKKNQPSEYYLFGDKCSGELVYTDKTATKVSMVNAFIGTPDYVATALGLPTTTKQATAVEANESKEQ